MVIDKLKLRFGRVATMPALPNMHTALRPPKHGQLLTETHS